MRQYAVTVGKRAPFPLVVDYTDSWFFLGGNLALPDKSWKLYAGKRKQEAQQSGMRKE